MVALMIVGLILCALTADYLVLRVRTREEAVTREPVGPFIAPGHVWLMPGTGDIVRVGADAMASLLLGKPERIEWSCAGPVRLGDPLAVLQRGTRRLTLVSPVDGVVIERNDAVAPASIALDPLGTWLVRVKAANLPASLARAVSGERLREWSRRELERLRSFVLSQRPRGTVGATAADGGPLGPDLSALLDDETWSRAVELFFDVTPDFAPAPQAVEVRQ